LENLAKMGFEIKKNLEDGFFSFLLRVIGYIKKNYLGIWRAIIFESEIDNKCQKKNSDLKLNLRLATKKDIDSMDKENFKFNEKAKKYFIDRLEKGDRCILSLNNNKIIGYLWAMKDSMEITPFRHFTLSKNRAYLYNAFVLKEFRRKRVITAMHEYIYEILKKEGKRFIVLVIDADNKSSLKTRNSARDKKIGHIIHFRFFGLKYDHIKKKNLLYLQN